MNSNTMKIFTATVEYEVFAKNKQQAQVRFNEKLQAGSFMHTVVVTKSSDPKLR